MAPSPQTVRAVIGAQFGHLALDTLRLLGSGWDNDVWFLEPQTIFRFPRRQLAIRLLEHERDLLPALAPALPLPIPVPKHLGQPSDDFGAIFNGYEHIEGQTCCRANPDEQTRSAHAAPLGRFLGALHSVKRADLGQASVVEDELGRADLQRRLAWYAQQLERLVSLDLMAQAQASQVLLEAQQLILGLEDCPAHERCLVHGDLYVRHLLVDERGQLCGVIDFGDVHFGDPALDLSIAWTYLPEAAMSSFLEAYAQHRPISEACLKRARALSLRSGVALLDYGHDLQDHDLVREARRIITRFVAS